MGITKNDGDTPKYSYYIDTQRAKFIVNIELPGGGFFKEPQITSIPGYYLFRFEGEQNGELLPKFKNSEKEKIKDEDYEELNQENDTSINLSKNLRKRHPIHIEFTINTQIIQLKYSNNGPNYSIEPTSKGIIIFIFDVHLMNMNKSEKTEENIIKF